MEPSLKSKLIDKNIIIWGARIVGIGLSRKCRDEGLSVSSIIDSDKAMIGRNIGGVNVNHPSSLLEYKSQLLSGKAILILAVSIKEDEIKSQIDSLIGSSNIEVINYVDYNPAFYTIDIVGACNLHCLSCAHSIENHDTPLNSMSIENVTKVIAKLKIEAPNCSHVSLYSWGEPLIHPQLKEIIELFHAEGIAVGLSTNLSHENFDKIQRALMAKPDYLKISLSGYYADAYNSTHQGGDIDLVKSNLYKLKYYIKKMNLDLVVDINYHMYKNNNRTNFDKMYALSQELGFVFSNVYSLVMPLERVINYINGNPDNQTLELEENLLVNINEGINASKSIELDNGCPFKHNQLNINSDLTVPVCCLVFNRDNLVAKNYLDVSLDEINSNKEVAEICNKCMKLNLPQYNMGFNRENWEKIAESKVSLDL